MNIFLQSPNETRNKHSYLHIRGNVRCFHETNVLSKKNSSTRFKENLKRGKKTLVHSTTTSKMKVIKWPKNAMFAFSTSNWSSPPLNLNVSAASHCLDLNSYSSPLRARLNLRHCSSASPCPLTRVDVVEPGSWFEILTILFFAMLLGFSKHGGLAATNTKASHFGWGVGVTSNPWSGTHLQRIFGFCDLV